MHGAHEETSNAITRVVVGVCRRELGEGPRKHDAGESRGLGREHSEGLCRGAQHVTRIVRQVHPIECCAKSTKAFEEKRAYYSGLITEEFIDRRRRRVRRVCQCSRGEPIDAFGLKDDERSGEYLRAQTFGSLLYPGHASTLPSAILSIVGALTIAGHAREAHKFSVVGLDGLA